MPRDSIKRFVIIQTAAERFSLSRNARRFLLFTRICFMTPARVLPASRKSDADVFTVFPPAKIRTYVPREKCERKPSPHAFSRAARTSREAVLPPKSRRLTQILPCVRIPIDPGHPTTGAPWVVRDTFVTLVSVRVAFLDLPCARTDDHGDTGHFEIRELTHRNRELSRERSF